VTKHVAGPLSAELLVKIRQHLIQLWAIIQCFVFLTHIALCSSPLILSKNAVII